MFLLCNRLFYEPDARQIVPACSSSPTGFRQTQGNFDTKGNNTAITSAALAARPLTGVMALASNAVFLARFLISGCANRMLSSSQ